MFTLDRTTTFLQDIRKSRFRAVAGPVAGEAQARDFLAAHSDPDASHNCWAWRVGQACRSSDDGEPSGTAGRPILQAIDGQELDGVAVVVTRWFGGVLLGSGGLMRAYGGTAAACLRQAEKLPVVARVEARVACLFSDLALLKARLLAVPDLSLRGETFTATGAELALLLPVERVDAVARMVSDTTSGRAHIAG